MAIAADLENFLGQPFDSDAAISFKSILEYDEREEPVAPLLSALHEWGYTRFFIPHELGGRLQNMEQIFALVRAVSRRDIASAVSSGATLLAACPVWSWGTAAQRIRVAEIIAAGGYGSFGLSEADHGSDVVAAECTAEQHDSGYFLSGTKWPVGNASRGEFATIFGRTGPTGPRGLSTFFVDKPRLDPVRWRNESQVKMMSVRSCDISGITFDRCAIAPDSVIGEPGRGLTYAIKTLQASRSMVTAMSLGAGDTGLRVALRHARSRILYGKPVYDIPIIREQLVSAYIDLIIVDCVARAAARAVAVAPERLSLWSAVAKYIVPNMVDEVMSEMGSVLGARHLMREEVADGIFQKMFRDHRLISVFDGTGHVQLSVVAGQLAAVLVGKAQAATGSSGRELLGKLFGVHRDQPVWSVDLDDFKLTNGGIDEIVQQLPSAIYEAIGAAAEEGGAGGQALSTALGELRLRYNNLVNDVAETLHAGALGTTASGFRLARRYCLMSAAAACLHTWNFNRHVGDPICSPEWPALALRRILFRLGSDEFVDPVCLASVESMMLESLHRGWSFSLAPVPHQQEFSAQQPPDRESHTR